MKNFQFSPFDFVLIAFAFVGFLRGKKRGISNELLDVLQWLGIVVGAGLGYRLLGPMLSSLTQLPIMFANIMAYLFVAMIVTFIFKGIKRAVGEKLAKGDAFGRFEFYLGMVAGAVRFLCMALFALALLNSYYTTAAERAATAKTQQDNLGTISFPTLPSLQQSIFVDSYSGKFIDKYLQKLLIERVPPGQPKAASKTPNAIERVLNRATGGK